MASFTSTQDGNWNDGDNWGNISPGDKGTDWPGLAGDTASIGHIITYNVSETNELGTVAIAAGGILTFKTDGNTKITFGVVDLTIANGGELRVGASGAVIDSAVVAELLWSNTTKGIVIANGGICNMYGDPAYFGSDVETYFADNAENADGDADIIVQDDMSAKWNVGDLIAMHIKTAYSNYASDVQLQVISGFSGTTISLDGNVTADANCVGKIVNCTRNVTFGKLGALTGIADRETDGPRITDSNVTKGNLNFNCVKFQSIGRISGTAGIDFINSSVMCNGHYSVMISNCTFDAIMYAQTYFFWTATGHILTGGTYFAIDPFTFYPNGAADMQIDAGVDVYSCKYFMRGVNTYTFAGNVYGCYLPFSYEGRGVITGRVGYDANDIETPNSIDFCFCFASNHLLKNVKEPSGGWAYTLRNLTGRGGKLFFEHADQVSGAHAYYHGYGDATKVDADGGGSRPSQRSGGAEEILEIVTQSLCSTAEIFDEVFKHIIWAETGVAKTYRYYVQSDYVTLPTGEIELSGEYLDTGAGGHVATIQSDEAITTRSNQADWSQYIEVTITPAQAGLIELTLDIMGYEIGKTIWVDPQVVIL